MPRYPIYTIGLEGVKSASLVDAMGKYEIDCVVDIRGRDARTAKGVFSEASLYCAFSEAGFTYMSFRELLGALPCPTPGSGNVSPYELAVTTGPFAVGLNRLRTGIDRGFHILLIDDKAEPLSTIRHSVIGRYLTERKYSVLHIFPSGICLSQDEIDDQQTKRELAKERQAQAIALGKCGEELATQYLREHGYIILDRNWNLHRGCELDIVALKDDMVHFVEVKTRSSDRYAPQEAIDLNKLRNLRRAMNEYRNLKHIHRTPYQLDSIIIVGTSETDCQLKHYENIGVYVTKNYNAPYSNY